MKNKCISQEQNVIMRQATLYAQTSLETTPRNNTTTQRHRATESETCAGAGNAPSFLDMCDLNILHKPPRWLQSERQCHFCRWTC
jgi:hypothetical protein